MRQRNRKIPAKFEVLIVVHVKAQVFWEVTPCRVVKISFSGLRGGSYSNDSLLDACNEMGRVCGNVLGGGRKGAYRFFFPETSAREPLGRPRYR